MDPAIEETGQVSLAGAASTTVAIDPDEAWQWACAQLRREYGRAQVERWLAPLRLARLGPGRVRLEAANAVLGDWVRRHYLARIRTLLAGVGLVVEDLKVTARDGAHSRDGAQAGGKAAAADARVAAPAISREACGAAGKDADRQAIVCDSFGGRLEPRYRFETFVVGKSNAFAHAAARRVAESATPSFNPLFLHGGVGLGKTHLMHAIAWAYRENFPDRKVMYVSAEQFMYQFIAAVRYRDTMSFKQQFRSVDLLLLDDVQFIAGKDSTQ